MSVSREWNSLKAAWIIMLLALVARIFLSGQFLLTPEEAVYWQTSQYPLTSGNDNSPIFTFAIWLSTSLFGNSEMAVRLPAILALTLAAIYMTLMAANMFSWHTALHVTLLTHGILQFNMAALVVTPYSLILPCWAAVCYHASQAMHDNRTGQWLFAGFWFGIGLLCNFSMILLFPCLILCFILIKPFRTCLLYAGPWFGFLLSLSIFILVAIWLEKTSLLSIINKENLNNIAVNFIPDAAYSLQFIIDQVVLLTPVVLLLILAGWLTGSNKRHLVKSDVHFLILTSFPLFLLYLIFPAFAGSGPAWSAAAFVSAIVLIAGLHSSTRSSFKGRPNHRWILAVTTAYCFTIPLILQITYPAAMPLTINMSQTRLAASGWDQLGKRVDQSFHLMPNLEKTFIFSMEQRLAAELAFYIPGNPHTISLDHRTRSNRQDFFEKEMQLAGQDGLGLVSTQAALEQVKLLFDRVELEKEITLQTTTSSSTGQDRTFYIIRGFGFKKL